MILLTKRQEAILYYILGGKESITTKKLASRYQLSERMIHYDLEYIGRWLIERGCQLGKSKGRYSINVNEEQKYQLLEELLDDDVQQRILTKADRQQYIYDKLLLCSGTVSSDEIVEDLQISKPTVLNDLKEVEKIAARYNLALESKKGIGYWLKGREIDIRRQLVQALTSTLIQNHIEDYEQLGMIIKEPEGSSIGYYSLVIGYIKGIDIEPISEIMNELRGDSRITISDIDCFDLFIAILVMVRRLAGEHTLKKENIFQIKKGEETQSYYLGRSICERLEEEYEIYCSKIEVNYVVLTLISTNVTVGEDVKEVKDHHLEEIVEQMLGRLKDYPAADIDSGNMAELKEELKDYLDLLLRKRKLNIKSQNPLLAQTKAEYTELFEEAARMAAIFREKTGLSLTQEEIGMMTVYIATHSDYLQGANEKKAVIVCDENKSIARLLENRLKNNIANLTIIGFLSVYKFNQDRSLLKSADFVISTAKLQDVKIPVFRINPIISAVDIRSINDYVSGRKSIQVMVDSQKKEGYLKDAVLGALGKYVDSSRLGNLKDELDYILSAGSNLISVENSKYIKEEYAYKVSMILVKLSETFKRIHQNTGRMVEQDTMMGLAIHVTMSAGRWEQKEFYQEKAVPDYKAEEQLIYVDVEQFLDEVSEVFQHKIETCEAVAIMRYLI